MIAVVLVHLVLVVWAWPWFSRRDKLWILLLLGLFVPIISWPVLAPLGVVGWSDLWVDRREQRLELERQRRQEVVCFLRDQLVNGTPVEQANAREILAMWGESEVQPEAAQVAPVVIKTERPDLVHTSGNWLVVNDLARNHPEPPSLERYALGCHCPACTHLYDMNEQAKRATRSDWQSAVDQVVRQVSATLSVPPAILGSPVRRGFLDCPDCDVQEVQQRNGAGQTVIVWVTGRTCREHGSVDVNWTG